MLRISTNSTRHFIDKYSRELYLTIQGITPEAMAMLQQYSWPGNIRQLENVIERACNLLGNDGYITESVLPAYIVSPTRQKVELPIDHYNLLQNKGEFEKANILQAIANCQGNRTQAAKLLGITRTALYQKIKKYGI